jgi:16S rRNA (cytosine967-C5)-methyltransferase
MQSGARLQAAIDVLGEILDCGRPASLALADWGRSHRFAGSADRGWIGNLVYDGLRRKQSLSYLMRNETPREIALGALRHSWNVSADDLGAICSGEGFAAAPLTPEEQQALANTDLSGAAPWIQGDYPEWLHPSFSLAFNNEAVAEGRALATRAPVDLRTNTLKATREKVLKAFARQGAVETYYSPAGVRLPAREAGARSPNVESDPAHGRGWFEVQDEGSQVAAVLAGAGPRMQVADICAGAGGKTLAMAAQMQNTGQIYAYDTDPIRFRPIFERLKRAGARNVQTLPPGDPLALNALESRMDLVLIDAPCSGTGVWRRRPDAKWRLNPSQLQERIGTQRGLLLKAASLVRPGGALVYVTCSVLPEENAEQIEAFLKENPTFRATEAFGQNALAHPIASSSSASSSVLLTPAKYGTDGFYIAFLRKSSA